MAKDNEIREQIDQAVLETLETVNADEDVTPEQMGAAIQASEILSRTRNEMRKSDMEVAKLEAETEKLKAETAKLTSDMAITAENAKLDKKHYWIDHLITAGGLITVLHYERFEINGSKLFSHAWSSFSKGLSNTWKFIKH